MTGALVARAQHGEKLVDDLGVRAGQRAAVVRRTPTGETVTPAVHSGWGRRRAARPAKTHPDPQVHRGYNDEVLVLPMSYIHDTTDRPRLGTAQIGAPVGVAEGGVQ